MTDRPALATSLQRLAAILGPVKAQRLAEALGGVEQQYIPKIAVPGHPLAKIVGDDGLAALIAAFGGEYLDIPRGAGLGAVQARVIAALDGGASARQAALAVRCTQRYVRKVREKTRPDPAEPALPGLLDSP